MIQSSLFTSYSEVNALLYRLHTDIKSVLQGQFKGMYLHGSLALGDFNPESSDIDFLVLTASDLTSGMTDALRKMHSRIENDHIKWGRKLEGSYLPANLLKEESPPTLPRPYINGGNFCFPQYGYEWALEKYVLREHGIIIEGPPIATWIPPLPPEEVRRATSAIFNDWWLPMLTESTPLQDAEYQAYAVLTMCRIIFTLKHSRIVSKPKAAAWMNQEFNDQWATLIETVLSWREGQPLNLLQEVLDLIKFTDEYNNKKIK